MENPRLLGKSTINGNVQYSRYCMLNYQMVHHIIQAINTDSVELLLHQWPSHPREPARAWRWEKDCHFWPWNLPQTSAKIDISPPGIEGRCLTCEDAAKAEERWRIHKSITSLLHICWGGCNPCCNPIPSALYWCARAPDCACRCRIEQL